MGIWVTLRFSSEQAPDEVYLGDESKKSPQKKATDERRLAVEAEANCFLVQNGENGDLSHKMGMSH